MTPFTAHRRRIAELRRTAQPAVEQPTEPAPPPEPIEPIEPIEHEDEHG